MRLFGRQIGAGSIVGGILLLGNALVGAMDWVARWQYLVRLSRKDNWVGSTVSFIVDPPGWFVLLTIVFGFGLIYWDLQRAHELPIEVRRGAQTLQKFDLANTRSSRAEFETDNARVSIEVERIEDDDTTGESTSIDETS